jgi:hypothetical protein
MADPLSDLIGWFGEKMFEAADDAVVDNLVKAGDVSAADAPVLKKAGPIYLKAILTAMEEHAQPK